MDQQDDIRLKLNLTESNRTLSNSQTLQDQNHVQIRKRGAQVEFALGLGNQSFRTPPQ